MFTNAKWDAIETAAHECVSDEALSHLKAYKYSSVDKSLISRYILKHYVRTLPHSLDYVNTVSYIGAHSGMDLSNYFRYGSRRIWSHCLASSSFSGMWLY